MKIWRSIAVFFMGVAAAFLLAFKMQKPGTVINQQIKKMKARGTGNIQEVQMETNLPKSVKRSFVGRLLGGNPKKKAARQAKRAAKKKK